MSPVSMRLVAFAWRLVASACLAAVAAAAALALEGPAHLAGEQCPLSHGFWKTHSEAWPRLSLVQIGVRGRG